MACLLSGVCEGVSGADGNRVAEEETSNFVWWFLFFFFFFFFFWVKVEERRRSLKELEMNGRRNINIERYSRPNKSLVLKSYLAQPFVSLFPSLSLSLSVFFYGILHRLMVGTFLSAYNPPQKLFFRYFFPMWKNPFFVLFFVFLRSSFCFHSSALAFSASLIPFVISHCH